MIDQLNHIAGVWWDWMWPMFWQVALLIVFIAAVDLVIRRWAWPELRYALWLLVLLKLVLPPSLSLSTSLTKRLPAVTEQAVKQPIEIAATAATDESPKLVLPAEEGSATAAPAGLPAVVPPAAETQIASPAVSWRVYAMGVWLVGMLTLGGYLVLRLRHLRMRTGANVGDGSLPVWLEQVLTDTAGRLKLRRIPGMLVSESVASPAVFGVFRPTLLLPADSVNNLFRKDAEHILLHELAHIKRGDLAVHTVCVLLQIVYWFNPLLWFVRRQLRHLRELCCDATVAKVLRERTGDYRETLLETARRLLAKPTESGLGLLGLFEDSNRLVTRLKWLEKKPWRHRTLRIGSVLVTVALMLMCVLPMAKAKTSEPDTKPTDKASPAKSPFTATLPNGVTVQLVGISDHPNPNNQWWAPDGSPIKEHWETHRGYIGGPLTKDGQLKRIVLRCDGAGEKPRLMTFKFDGQPGCLGGFDVCRDKEELSGWSGLVERFERKQDTATMSFAIATGPFKGHWTNQGKTEYGPFVLGSLHERNGNAAVVLSHNFRGCEFRIKAKGKNGKWYVGKRVQGGGCDGLTLATYVFEGVSDKAIQFPGKHANIELEFRPYKWVTFRNVSLKPGKKTKVQIEMGDAKKQGSIGRPTPLAPIGRRPTRPTEATGSLDKLRTVIVPDSSGMIGTKEHPKTLRQAFEFFRRYGVNVMVRWDVIDLEGISPDDEVRYEVLTGLKTLTLDKALELLLKTLGNEINYAVDADGLVVVSTLASLTEQNLTPRIGGLETRVYSLQGVIIDQGSHIVGDTPESEDAPKPDAETALGTRLTKIIVQLVHPETWVEGGGQGTIDVWRQRWLIVYQTPEVHAEVAKLLERIRTTGLPSNTRGSMRR